MYALLGLSTFIPVMHGLLLHSYPELNERISLNHFIGLGVLNFSGAAIYAARIPERWLPETFDLCGASHQIMHVLVVLGAISHEAGLVRGAAWWNSEGRQRCLF